MYQPIYKYREAFNHRWDKKESIVKDTKEKYSAFWAGTLP